MLILSRRAQESIVIGDHEITITVLGVIGKNVRLGITAPRNIKINREEVLRRIEMRQREEAQGEKTHEPV